MPISSILRSEKKIGNIEAAELQNTSALKIVTEIRKLYLIERCARDQSLEFEQRLKLRQEQARPILEALRPRLEILQSPLAKRALTIPLHLAIPPLSAIRD